MSMFENYDNLNPEYIPDNSSPKHTDKCLNMNKYLPSPIYDSKKHLIGYGWTYEEVFDFTISVDNRITVSSDSLIFENTEEKPDELTVGEYVGQKAYNIKDIKSWTYQGKSESFYVWVEDAEFMFPANGNKQIILKSDMSNRYILVDIFNFRGEKIHSQQSGIGENELLIKIDKELSEKLIPGVYYCKVKICSEDSVILKDKFTILVN